MICVCEAPSGICCWQYLYSFTSLSWWCLCHSYPKGPFNPPAPFGCHQTGEPGQKRPWACKRCLQAPRSRTRLVLSTIPQLERGLCRHSRGTQSRLQLLIRAVNSWTLGWYYFPHNGQAGRSHQLGQRSKKEATAKDDSGPPAVKVCAFVSFQRVVRACTECMHAFFSNWARWPRMEVEAKCSHWDKNKFLTYSSVFKCENRTSGSWGLCGTSAIFCHLRFITFGLFWILSISTLIIDV